MEIIRQQQVLEFVRENPGATPLDIASALNASVGCVKKRLLTLIDKRKLDRTIEKSRADKMFYYPTHRRMC